MYAVLILVLVEHTLGAVEFDTIALDGNCLNPCFSGTYSRSVAAEVARAAQTAVLILVLVEHTLGGQQRAMMSQCSCVLILVLVEHTLGEFLQKTGAKNLDVLILVLVEHTLGGQHLTTTSLCLWS